MILKSITQIKFLLIVTIITMSILPPIISYFILSDILNNSFSFSHDIPIQKIITDYQVQLKELKDIKEVDQTHFKRKYYWLEELRHKAKSVSHVEETLRKSYLTYFYIGIFLAIIIGTFISLIFSNIISQSYKKLFNEYKNTNKRLLDICNIEQWQILSKKLAHEIKNPLTPIELMVSSLINSYSSRPPNDFQKQLEETVEITLEEITKLKSMVEKYTDFSKLPSAKLSPVRLNIYLESFYKYYNNSWKNCTLLIDSNPHDIEVCLDKALFRQVLINLINNACEANPSQKTKVTISFSIINESIIINIKNTGQKIKDDDLPKIFKIYHSTKKNNMGIGLSIVQKIIFDHHGIIECNNTESGVLFCIKLPLTKEGII